MAHTNNCTTNWHLWPVCTSLNGRNKSAPICEDNKHVKLTLEQTVAPFGAGNFNKEETTRLNLDVSCTESYIAFLEKVDEWAIHQLSKDTKSDFKKQLTETELRAAYRPCATRHAPRKEWGPIPAYDAA